MKPTIAVAAMAALLTFAQSMPGMAQDQKTMSKDARPALVLTEQAISRINQGLTRDAFTFVFPTGVDAAPQGCPSGGNHCIWMCTGNDPLDDIDADTCSTDTYKCLVCGSDGGTVCQDSAGNTVPC